MLTDFTLIRNVGKFENCPRAPTLKQMTLIYAENARGKTTLTSILRSLCRNEPEHVAVRERLGTTNKPEIRIASTDESHVFEDGTWGSSYPNMLIFDDHFIEANVYSGMGIGRDQRIGLHEIILGEEGVTVARDLASIKREISSVNIQMGQLETELQPHTHGLTIDLFIALEETPDAAAQIKLKEALLAQIQQAEPILRQSAFERVDVPAFTQDSISDLLSLSLTDIDQGAIASVERHFSELGQQGEQWVQTGLDLAQERDACPFCDQDIQGNSQLDLYRAYFNTEYEQHVQSISDRSAGLVQSLEDAIRSLREAAAAEPRWTFWDQYIPDLPPLPDYGALADRSDALLRLLRDAFREKAQSPLAQTTLPEPLVDALVEYSTA